MPAPWFRSEQGGPLTAEQFDENTQYFIDRDTAIEEGAASPPYPSSIVQTDLTLTFYLSNAEVLGTATIPVWRVNYRGAWAADTAYFVGDVFTVRGVGDYLVEANFTSGTTFNPGETSIAFQRPDTTVQLPVYIDSTVGTLTVTRTDHVNRMLVFLGSCDVTIDPDDWLNGDQVHFMNQAAGGIVEIRGTTGLEVRPPSGDSSNISTPGGVASAVYLDSLDIMALFGRLDPEGTV